MTAATFGVIALASAIATPNSDWTEPFQGRAYSQVPSNAVPLSKHDCDGDRFNKCTFEIVVDFDRDGRSDHARMMNAGGQGIIVVKFGASQKAPMVVASFRSRFEGHSYIETANGSRDTISYVYPEASSAEIRLIGGRPKIHWTAD